MSPSSTRNILPDGNGGAGKELRLTGEHFAGRAIEPHTVMSQTPAGVSITRRSELGEMLYRYRYRGEGELLGKITDRFLRETDAFIRDGAPLDLIVMVPPPVSRPDYAPVVKLASMLSQRTGIPSAQYAVKSVIPEINSDQSNPRWPERVFAFSSPETARVFTGRRVLVIDDIYRSGRSLHSFCGFLKKEGRAERIEVLVGTIVRKPS